MEAGDVKRFPDPVPVVGEERHPFRPIAEERRHACCAEASLFFTSKPFLKEALAFVCWRARVISRAGWWNRQKRRPSDFRVLQRSAFWARK